MFSACKHCKLYCVDKGGCGDIASSCDYGTIKDILLYSGIPVGDIAHEVRKAIRTISKNDGERAVMRVLPRNCSVCDASVDGGQGVTTCSRTGKVISDFYLTDGGIPSDCPLDN